MAHIRQTREAAQRVPPPCLRHLLQIKWQDRVSNTNVLQRADVPSIPTLLIQGPLRWPGHVHRMEPDRLPRQVFYGELWEGSDVWANHSFALRMFASVICDSLNSIPIPGRSSGKTEVTIERVVRKERQVSVCEATNYTCTSCNKDCHSRIGF